MKEIIPAKLTRPSSGGALPRERLFESIESGRGKKILWISGPPGSGKTTLIASYFGHRKMPCLWYQLDEGDKDLATFFYYLGLAAKEANPRDRKRLPMLTPEYLQGIPVFAKRFFEQLGERLIRRPTSDPSGQYATPAVVFDDYQEIPDDSMFHEVISAGLSVLPQGVSVIVLSRSAPPHAYARLRASGELNLLGWEDIQLTADESNAIAVLKARRDLGGETLTHLYEMTKGWVAGLVLFIESMKTGNFDLAAHRDLPAEDIFGYFATELFDRRSKEDQEFLLETSLLPRMSARMAEKLTGNPRALSIFSSLNRSNYFTNRYAFSEPAFQYHPLFREFLLAKAEEIVPPERLALLRCRAAKVLEENGHVEDAVNLFAEAEEWPEATRMILAHAPALIAQGRWQTLQGWIESIPDFISAVEPWLLYWLGICRLRVSPDRSRECFGKSFERFRSAGDATGSFLALSGMLDSVTFRFDSFLDLDRLISMMDELLKEYPQFSSPMVESRVVASMLDALVLRQPDNPAWEYWEHRAAELAKEIADVDLALHILCGMAYYRLFSGELERVVRIFDLIHRKIEEVNATPLAVIVQRTIQAFYYWVSADFEKNRWAAEDGIALADSRGIHSMDFVLLGHATAGALSNGEIVRAEGYLKRMLSTLRMFPGAYGENMYHNLYAWKYLIDRNLTFASMHFDLAIEFSAAMGSPLTEPYQHLGKAIAMHRLGNDENAFQHLSRFRKVSGAMLHRQGEFMASLIEAQIEFDGGNEASGKKFLRRAMAVGREHGYANGFFWESSMMARLCVKALEAGIETEYVQSLIRRRRLVPDEPAYHVERWPWPFRIFTLGQFEMVRDSGIVTFSGKVQQKPVLLLKALIAFGGRQVNHEQLCEALWPDAEGDLAHRSFETTLYRLRQLIGKDAAIHLHDGRLTLDMQTCWVDAFALEQILEEAEGVWESSRGWREGAPPLKDQTARAIQLTGAAISLYRGHFLSTETELPWMQSPRERLRARFMRGIDALVRFWVTLGDFETAIRCCEKALEVNDLAEEFYQHLIICQRQLGRHANAVAIYNRCRSVLKARLGIEPSVQTESLIREFPSARSRQ